MNAERAERNTNNTVLHRVKRSVSPCSFTSQHLIVCWKTLCNTSWTLWNIVLQRPQRKKYDIYWPL